MKVLSWDVGIYNLSYCILEKTDDYNVSKLAKNIIQKQEDEIRDMKVILTDLKK